MTDTVIHSFKSNQTQEHPHIVPAVLTVLVHIALLGMLYLGMTLHTQQPAEVEIWDGAGLEAANNSSAASTAATAPSANQPTHQSNQAVTPSKVPPLPLEPIQEKTEPADISTPTTKKTTEKTIAATPITPDTSKALPKTEPKPNTAKPAVPANDSAARTAALERMKSGAASGGQSTGTGESRDSYAARVKAKITPYLPPKGLSASVAIRVSANGTVTSKNITRSSGNAEWDKALLAAITSAGQFPMPVHRDALSGGITIEFRH